MNLNPKKSTGPDHIPLRIIKSSANIIDSHITNIINQDIEKNRYSEDAKSALVRPIYKKEDRNKLKNYRPISLLNGFSKVYERFLHDNLSSFTEKVLSQYVSAYRKSYSSNHVLLRLIEEWKKLLDHKKFVGTVLMDLSKAFDCIPHDLLVAKLYAYGLSKNGVIFFYSYLKRRKQGVKINNTESIRKQLISGVTQGSILGPVLFNIFINDLFLFIKEAKLANFADDNTIYAGNEDLPLLLKILENESNLAIKWFNENNMIINPEKFQAMILGLGNQHQEKYCLRIDGKNIETKNQVTLLGVEIDDKLKFDKHISSLCKKSNNQLNALSRIQTFLGQKEKETMINTFIYSNFNYAPLVWHFSSRNSEKKIEKIQERCLRLVLNDYTSNYENLLIKSGKPSMELRRLRILVLEIFKTLNSLNPEFMREIFCTSPYLTHRKNNLLVPSRRTTKFGNNSLRVLGPHLWNSLPKNVKEITLSQKFIEIIKTWNGPECKCYLCSKS